MGKLSDGKRLTLGVAMKVLDRSFKMTRELESKAGVLSQLTWAVLSLGTFSTNGGRVSITK